MASAVVSPGPSYGSDLVPFLQKRVFHPGSQPLAWPMSPMPATTASVMPSGPKLGSLRTIDATSQAVPSKGHVGASHSPRLPQVPRLHLPSGRMETALCRPQDVQTLNKVPAYKETLLERHPVLLQCVPGVLSWELIEARCIFRISSSQANL